MTMRSRIALAVVVTLAAVGLAYIERGYMAIGGEWFVPALFAVLSGTGEEVWS